MRLQRGWRALKKRRSHAAGIEHVAVDPLVEHQRMDRRFREQRRELEGDVLGSSRLVFEPIVRERELHRCILTVSREVRSGRAKNGSATPAAHDFGHRAEQDHEVTPERPMLDVLVVESSALLD